uniref:Toll-like receptor 21 n=1 Tax=Oncorhynchus kisutch TaxID=8019 RepID=A0A8C7CDZ9_ONCKI
YIHMLKNMAELKNKTWVSVAIVLHISQFTIGYSFRKCTEDPTSNHTKFIFIHHQAKKISDIVGDLPPYATTIIISINLIKHIPNNTFVHLPNLKTLQIDNNHLETIDNQAFQNMSQLKSLNLSLNKISNLSSSVFQDLKNLANLSLNNNSVIRLPPGIFSSLSNLDVLILRQNYLNNFSAVAESVTHLSKLTKLDLCNNYLTSLHHSNHTDLPESLTTLYLCKNKLVTLACEWSFLSHVLLLDLSYNDQLPSRAFQGVDLRKLNYMRLRSTNVTVPELLNVSNVRGGNIDFSGMGLKTDNLLMELCSLLSTKVKFVKKLSLETNGIPSLWKNTLPNCPPIQGLLDLFFNKLRKVRCLQDQIKNSTAEKNHLTSLMSYNRQNLSFPNLTDLSYRYNRILNVNSFAFHHTPNAKTLQLAAFDNLTNLTFLSLDNSCAGVMQLQPGFCKNLWKLSKLNARNMGIRSFSNEVFGNLTELQILPLNQNVMQSLDVNVLEALPKLRYLDLRNIPLSYTCLNSDLKKLQQNIHNFNTNFFYLDLGEYLLATTTTVTLMLTIIPLSRPATSQPGWQRSLFPAVPAPLGAPWRSSRPAIGSSTSSRTCSCSSSWSSSLKGSCMRKVMLKKTYLLWLGSDCTDPVKAQDLFWNHLRRVLRSGSSRFEPPTDDAKHYLMPLGKV